MNYLMHYGVKGQKWGVRRYQNLDGSYTNLGKSRYRAIKANKTKDDVDDIVKTFNKKERELFGLKDKNEEYLSKEQGEYVLKRILLKYGDTPVAFFDMLDDGDTINIALGTRHGKEYRGKGYASKAAKQGLDWYEKHKDELGNKTIVWAPKLENEASIKIAEKLGFERDDDSLSDDGEWINYLKKY